MQSIGSLSTTLSKNVVELIFNRRRPRKGVAPTRRMLCTLDYSLLTSENGAKVLNYKPPIERSAYNPSAKGLIVVWDILKQDWRMVNTESCQVISTIPTNPPEQFWEYFNNNISSMSAAQKNSFINA